MQYEAVIGLEVHAQLLTNSKVFCRCSTKFGAEANTQVCPVCLGMPGTLPVLNRVAVEYAIKMALATHCKVNDKSIFARKNYFYPDLPKGYQISQYDQPLTQKGYVDIEVNPHTKDFGVGVNGAKRRIGITRIHMEEDAGKLLHGESYEDADFSFVDLNRAGVPLIEIVSEPDIRNSEEAVEYLKALRDILVYLEICDGNMEEGSFRCDANVSIRPVGRKEFGTKTELKNMNSFRFVQKAIDYEVNRQIEVIEDGGKVIQETLLFDSDKGITVSMRSKEEAHDYRYFPEPDLLPLHIDEAWIEEIKNTLPELPAKKRQRFIKEYGIPSYDAGVLTASKELANYYEECVQKYEGQGARGKGQGTAGKNVSNWVMGELLRLIKEDGKDITQPSTFSIQPSAFAKLLKMVDAGSINLKTAKEVFEDVYKTGKDPEAIVKGKGLVQISNEGALIKAIDEVIAANPKEVAEYKGGKEKLFSFFIGQTMKATKGQANPQVLNKLVKERLAK
ncbi:MAG: Asp-tRNA(Asn)/Glu-tRNA(Gln) amidotransferase subunit GatB [Deltaproteobacteria bacterium]|nr:Asp-tRNA(Asn)/Glu-tRNA(Gln) amidotransferase subunit GatB [Deltaproteobacteria bacterium]